MTPKKEDSGCEPVCHRRKKRLMNPEWWTLGRRLYALIISGGTLIIALLAWQSVYHSGWAKADTYVRTIAKDVYLTESKPQYLATMKILYMMDETITPDKRKTAMDKMEKDSLRWAR